MAQRWFELLAQQRMQLVSFWLVAMSFLTTGAVVALNEDQRAAAIVILGAIAAASVVFYLFDRRTQQLIDRGSDLMDHTELVLQKEYRDPHIELAGKMHETRSPTYRALFMWLYFGTAILAAAGAIAVVVAWVA